MQRYALIALAAAVSAAHADEATIRKHLAERYPGAPAVIAVHPTPLPGLFEVYTDGRLLYTDANADYLLMGPLIDTRARLNLSQQRLLELRKVPFDSLPVERAITMVKGKGERRIAVFSDPDCPYCRELEKELANIDNLTVHVFLLPLADLHPNAPAVARDIWCAADPARAWQAYMLEGVAPAGMAPAGMATGGQACDAPLAEIAELAGRLGINGTPALIMPDGRIVPGMVNAARLQALLAGS